MSSKRSEAPLSPGIKGVLSAQGSKESLHDLNIKPIEDEDIQFADEDDDNIHLKTQFPDLDDDGKDYADQIVYNIIDKLKIALNIPQDHTSHEQLQDFFVEKFRKPEVQEFPHNMPDQPSLEMLNAQVFGHMQDIENKQEEVKKETTVIREQMVGYVDAIIVRQDRHDIMKKMENFQIESTTRKVLKELVEHYNDLQERADIKSKAIKDMAYATSKQVNTQETLVKKLQSQVMEIKTLDKKIMKEIQMRETLQINQAKQTAGLSEQIEQAKKDFTTKIENLNALDDRIKMIEKQVQNVENITLKTKYDIFDEWNKQKKETVEQQQKLQRQEARLDETIRDAEYWLTNYADSFKKHDKNMNGLREELNGRMDNLHQQLHRRVTVRDMKLNSKRMNNLLWVKFKQLEDTKTSLRDVLTYQKYFYPIQMQNLLSENMQNIELAQEDQGYMQYTQRKFAELEATVEKVKKENKEIIDQDLQHHYAELDGYHLRTQEWKQTPLDNPEHDFVTDLIERYINDLKDREKKGAATRRKTALCDLLRKNVRLDAVELHINGVEQDARNLRQAADEKEQELEKRRLAFLLEKRCSKAITHKLDFKKAKAFKRSNSNLPDLGPFGDIEDTDNINAVKLESKKTFQINRNKYNARVQDCTKRRFVKDLMRSDTMEGSVPDSDDYDNITLPPELQTHPDSEEEEETVTGIGKSKRGIGNGFQNNPGSMVQFQNVRQSKGGTFRAVKPGPDGQVDPTQPLMLLIVPDGHGGQAIQYSTSDGSIVANIAATAEEIAMARASGQVGKSRQLSQTEIQKIRQSQELNMSVHESDGQVLMQDKPQASQKVRDSTGKVIGVYSQEDGQIRAPDGQIIGTKNADGQIITKEGQAMQGVTISQTVEYLPQVQQLGTSIVRDDQGTIIGICNIADGVITAPDGKFIGMKEANGQVRSTEGQLLQGVNVSQTIEYATVLPVATQKVKDAEGKVIGVCSVIDGKIRDTAGKVIGKRTVEGKVEMTDGKVIEGVRISQTIEFTPGPVKTVTQRRTADLGGQMPMNRSKTLQKGVPGFNPANFLAALGGKGGGGGPAGPMDPAEKRKLMKEIKDEMKPLINQLCDFQIEKANQIIKNNLRKLETDLSVSTHKLSKKIDRDVKGAKVQATDQRDELLARLEDEIGLLYKNIARNKTDTDLQHNRGKDQQKHQEEELIKYNKYFNTMAEILSSLIENVNMQMEGETADLLDRRMMQLYGVAFDNPKKGDMLDVEKHLQNAKDGKQSPFGTQFANKLMNGTIPELGLTSPRKLPKLSKSGIDPAECIDSDDENDKIDKKVTQAYQKKTTFAQENLRKEFNVAFDHLKNVGKLPFSIDNSCLSCQSSGRDVGITMKMFKTACMTYQSSNVAYREHSISRISLIGMRRDIIDKMQAVLEASPMFQQTSAFPRRYFDDLVAQQAMHVQQADNEAIINHNRQNTISEFRLTEMLQTAKQAPFQQISGKQPGLETFSKIIRKAQSPRYKAQDTHQSVQQMIATSGSIFSPSPTQGSYNIMQNQMINGNPIQAHQTMQLLQQNVGLKNNVSTIESAERLQNLSINLETETAQSQSNMSQPMNRNQMKAHQTMRAVRNKTMNKSPSAMLDTTGGMHGILTLNPNSPKKKPKYKNYLNGQQSQAKLPDPHQMSSITLQPQLNTGQASGLGRTARKGKSKKPEERMFGANAVSFTTSPTSMRDQTSISKQHAQPPVNLQIPNILTQLNERNSDSQHTRRDVPMTSSNNYSLPQI